MKTLYLYSDKTGIAKSQKKVEKINRKLHEIFDNLTIIKTENIEDFTQKILESAGIFDILIVAGGDGTLKHAVTILMSIEKDKRPVLGYLPTGTVNDAGKAIGIKGSISQAIKILKTGHVDTVDVCKVNDQYFNFVCAVGAYSDISYATKRAPKKVIGKFAYYFGAIPRLFRKKTLHAHVEADDKTYDLDTPFLMVMNSKNVGGFPVNFHYSVVDGLAEIYITKPGILNGLLHYIFFKRRVIKLKAKHIKISINTTDFFCYDGEKGEQSSVEITVLQKELKVIGYAK